MFVFSKTSEKCKSCDYFDDCDNKRMVACALMEMPQQTAATENAALPAAQDISIKHDYRDVWIDANTTVTIDLEDVKKQIESDLYKVLYCPFLNYGA